MIMQKAVVCNMGVRHDETVVAHYGFAFGSSPAMYGCTLTDNSIIADDSKGIFTSELQVLGDSADYSRRKDGTIVADAGAVQDRGIRHNLGAGTDDNVGFYICERTYFCCRINNS
jgi:hypothetical protein